MRHTFGAKIPMHSNVAMTGEITLTGKVLPIGGLKEKALAAARHKKEMVLIPAENEKDLDELPKMVRQKIKFITVKRADDVFKIVFDDLIYKVEEPDDEKKIEKAPGNEIVTHDKGFEDVIVQQ
jgi:ATP-dependent Lon protease